MKLEGLALKYEDADNVSTDEIWPGKYTYVQMNPEEMVGHAMEGFDPEFARKAAANSILIVGKNFGIGSSREQAAECIKYAGIQAIIGRSFARIFYRNAINIGLPVIEAPRVVDLTKNGDRVVIDLESGLINVGDNIFEVSPFPAFVQDLLRHGGLINMLRRNR